MKLKKGDEVQVVRGKDKGKKEKIEQVFTELNKVLVTGVNQYKRHLKGTAQGQRSEIVTITKPLPVSNVMLVCPKCHQLARVGFRFERDIKVRYCKKCEQRV